MADLRGEDSFPARSKWFSARYSLPQVLEFFSELKSPERCPFIRTRYFCSLFCFVNTNAFGVNDAQNNSPVESKEAEVKRLKAKEKDL